MQKMITCTMETRNYVEAKGLPKTQAPAGCGLQTMLTVQNEYFFPFFFGEILISRNTKVNKQDSWQSTSGTFSIRLTVLCETKSKRNGTLRNGTSSHKKQTLHMASQYFRRSFPLLAISFTSLCLY